MTACACAFCRRTRADSMARVRAALAVKSGTEKGPDRSPLDPYGRLTPAPEPLRQ